MDKQAFITAALGLMTRYTPNEDVKSRLAHLDLIAVVGPTGAGKNTIINESGFAYVLTDMTRKPRKHETDGVDANFRFDYDGLLRDIENGSFVQYFVNRNEEFYGTKDTSYPEEGLCTMPIYAEALSVFTSLPFRKVIPVYIVPPTYDELRLRANAHHDLDLRLRLAEAKRSLEIALSSTEYHFILNDDLARATRVFKEYAVDGRGDAEREKRARETALKLLTSIDY